MPRFVLTARRISLGDASAVQYLSKNGFTTYSAERCAVINSEKEARAELEYLRRTSPIYQWTIEKLPPRVPVSAAVLRAQPVD